MAARKRKGERCTLGVIYKQNVEDPEWMIGSQNLKDGLRKGRPTQLDGNEEIVS